LEQGGSTSYFVEQREEDMCWKCGGLHGKKDCLNLLQATTTSLNPNQTLYSLQGL